MKEEEEIEHPFVCVSFHLLGPVSSSPLTCDNSSRDLVLWLTGFFSPVENGFLEGLGWLALRCNTIDLARS